MNFSVDTEVIFDEKNRLNNFGYYFICGFLC